MYFLFMGFMCKKEIGGKVINWRDRDRTVYIDQRGQVKDNLLTLKI